MLSGVVLVDDTTGTSRIACVRDTARRRHEEAPPGEREPCSSDTTRSVQRGALSLTVERLHCPGAETDTDKASPHHRLGEPFSRVAYFSNAAFGLGGELHKNARESIPARGRAGIDRQRDGLALLLAGRGGARLEVSSLSAKPRWRASSFSVSRFTRTRPRGRDHCPTRFLPVRHCSRPAAGRGT
jgi:hypothetical protein